VTVPPKIARLIGDRPMQLVTTGRSHARVWRIGVLLSVRASLAVSMMLLAALAQESFAGTPQPSPVPVKESEYLSVDGAKLFLMTRGVD
jgi:hypothetical protein